MNLFIQKLNLVCFDNIPCIKNENCQRTDFVNKVSNLYFKEPIEHGIINRMEEKQKMQGHQLFKWRKTVKNWTIGSLGQNVVRNVPNMVVVEAVITVTLFQKKISRS